MSVPGGVCSGEVSALGGVCLGVGVGSVCSQGVSAPRGCLLPGGVCSQGVSALGRCLLPGGVSAPGGCLLLGEGRFAPGAGLLLGGVCSWGVSAPGGYLLPGGGGVPGPGGVYLVRYSPPVDRHTPGNLAPNFVCGR